MEISEKAKSIARQIANKEQCDVYLWNGPVNEDGVGALIQSTALVHRDVLLVLVTYGGSANSAYRAARYLQTIYNRVAVFVPSYCKSAGTLLAIGAHRLIMTTVSEFGPLDVQIYKRDEIGERRSGLLLRSAMTSLNEHAADLFTHLMMSVKFESKGLIRFRLASQLAVEMTKGLVSPIYSQITPEGLGEDYQDLMVAVEYGKRLAAVSGIISDKSIYKLVHSYPSHDFVIDKAEAKTLFNKIDDATDDMYSLMTELAAFAFVPDGKKVTVEALSRVNDVKRTTDGEANEREPKPNGIDRATPGKPRTPVAPARPSNRRRASP